jgi:uncharacterized protein YbgA (DUF1722 family)/uncharacterized protein YbbK (DUF523 family)
MNINDFTKTVLKDPLLEGNINVGLSACLAGSRVRFNGDSATDRFITKQLGEYFTYSTVCPEVGSGMSTPRETVRVVAQGGELRMKNRAGDHDYTDSMKSFIEKDLLRVEQSNLDGFIFKSGSPSCGAYRIKVYNEQGATLHKDGTGMYAARVMENMPWLPVEEEGRLNDPALLENFISRVFAVKRWRSLMASGVTISALIEFHERHKYWLMAHNQQTVSLLGKTLANAKGKDLNLVASEYLRIFMDTCKKPPSRRNHTNVLYHVMGYFSKALEKIEKVELIETIEKYRLGIVPLILPITALKNTLRKKGQDYLTRQTYFSFPEELGLLNKI